MPNEKTPDPMGALDALDAIMDKLTLAHEASIAPPTHEKARKQIEQRVSEEQSYLRSLEDTVFAADWQAADPEGYERAHRSFWSPNAVKKRLKKQK